MYKIRKGSIVWDNVLKEKTKVLSRPGTGELPDALMQITGYHRMPHFVNHVLVEERNPNFIGKGMTCNNKPCYIRSIGQCIPYKQYLKQRVEAISLGQGASNNPYIN
jgi:hypothetical protein